MSAPTAGACGLDCSGNHTNLGRGQVGIDVEDEVRRRVLAVHLKLDERREPELGRRELTIVDLGSVGARHRKDKLG